MRQMVLEILHFKVRNFSEQDGRHPFCWFSASFSLKYDITEVILQDNEKMKVKDIKSLLFDLFETLQAIRT